MEKHIFFKENIRILKSNELLPTFELLTYLTATGELPLNDAETYAADIFAWCEKNFTKN